MATGGTHSQTGCGTLRKLRHTADDGLRQPVRGRLGPDNRLAQITESIFRNGSRQAGSDFVEQPVVAQKPAQHSPGNDHRRRHPNAHADESGKMGRLAPHLIGRCRVCESLDLHV